MFNMSNQSEKIFLKKSQANTLFYIQKKYNYAPNVNIIN